MDRCAELSLSQLQAYFETAGGSGRMRVIREPDGGGGRVVGEY